MVSTYRNQRASRLGRGWRISASTCSGWWGVLCPRMHGFNLDGGGEHAASSRDGRNSHPMLESASAFDQPSPGSAESIYWSMVDDTVALTTVSAIRRGYRGFTVYPPLFSVPRLHGSFADPPSPGLGLHRASGAPRRLSSTAFDYSTSGRLCHGLPPPRFDTAGQTGAGRRPAATSMCTTHP